MAQVVERWAPDGLGDHGRGDQRDNDLREEDPKITATPQKARTGVRVAVSSLVMPSDNRRRSWVA